MNHVTWIRLLLLGCIALGHIGFWLWLFNRVNALGLARVTIKRLEKSVVLICLLLPFAILVWECFAGAWGSSWTEFWERVHSQDFYRHGSVISLLYFGFVLAFLVLMGPLWLAHRPVFTIAKDRYRFTHRGVHKNLHNDFPEWVTGSMTRVCLRIPGNQILCMERNCKRLKISDLEERYVGMRIGHISDIHLMGQIAPDYTKHCVDWILEHDIELLVVSGDLVDREEAVPHLQQALGAVPPTLPRVFLLGNHDKAHDLVEPACQMMTSLGWHDIGAADWTMQSARGPISIFGNELPWLDRHASGITRSLPGQNLGFWLGIAHSPDQWEWARSLGCHLLLCGHTHGGQVRIPGIGPIVAPSRYGSRFASGVFYRPPTLMHVSRGVSGTHPLRWRCMPEASVLELATSL